jgi:lipopolysaccharide export system permease protein
MRGITYAMRTNPGILQRLVLGQTLRRWAGAELFLLGIFLLAELFSSMWRLLALEAKIGDILLWVGAGLPAHAVEVLPIALLFAITMSLSELHSDGEFLAICSSGISIQSLGIPLLAMAAILGLGLRVSGDLVTVPASLLKENLYRRMTGQGKNIGSLSEMTILAGGGRFVYRIGFSDPETGRLENVDIVGKALDGSPEFRILASRAKWAGDRWEFSKARVYSAKPDGSWTEASHDTYSREDLNESPSSFAVLREKPSLMKQAQLTEFIRILKASGLPSVEAQTEYHKRQAFLLTPLIVCGLSIAASGLFRKNNLLMSLLFSLGTATVYYVAQMLASLAAKTGWLRPEFAIWSVTAFFFILAAAGYLKARS